jgi:hypothetical protein
MTEDMVWRRGRPDEDADEYMRRLGEQWDHVPGLDTFVVYDRISPGDGM